MPARHATTTITGPILCCHLDRQTGAAASSATTWQQPSVRVEINIRLPPLRHDDREAVISVGWPSRPRIVQRLTGGRSDPRCCTTLRRSAKSLCFFFFGTLMDREVLEIVLDRRVAENELAPAWLSGYRRVRTAKRPYPMLKPDPSGVTEGVLLQEASSRDEMRIRHFEDEEYVDRPAAVRLASGQEVEARVFFALAGLGETDEPWDPGSWACRHKPAFLRQCRKWMRHCQS